MYDCQQLKLMYQIHQVKNDNDYTSIKSSIIEEKKWWYGTGVNMSKKLQNNRPARCAGQLLQNIIFCYFMHLSAWIHTHVTQPTFSFFNQFSPRLQQLLYFCPACRTYLITTRFWVVVICPIIKCLTVLEFSFILFDLCLLSHPSILGVTLCFCTGSYAAAGAAAGRRFLFTR